MGTRGLAPRAVGAPMVHPAVPQVTGMLSPEVIRRVVLRNLAQVNRCYERGLAVDPALAGRISVRFVVGPDGTVTAAAVQTSDLPRADVGACVSAAIRGWLFPFPRGGPVVITYPFVFSPPQSHRP